MIMEYTGNKEYEMINSLNVEGNKIDAEKRADELYNKALDLSAEILEAIEEYKKYFSAGDYGDLIYLMESIEESVSIEMRERIGRE